MSPPLLEDTYQGDRPLRTLVALFAGQRGRLAIGALAFVIKHSPVWVMPVLTADVIDIVVQHRPLSELWLAAGFMGVLVAVNLPLSQVFIRALSKSVRTVETDLRMALARRLQELSIGYHRRISPGVLQAKIVRDVENVVEGTRQSIDTGLAAITTLIGAIVITAIRVPEFLIVFALAVPASAALIVAMRTRMTARNRAFRTQVEQMSARVSEMTHLVPITRAHALEADELARVDQSLLGVREAGIRLDVVNGRFGALSWVVFQLLSVLCLVGAAWVAWTGTFDVSAGDVVMLSSYFMSLTGSVTALLSLAPIIAKGLESVRSMGEVLTEPDIERNAGKADAGAVRGSFSFEDVTFAYSDAPDEHAISGLNLEVRPGETIAFVGPSGSGKSTVLNMVIGFLTPVRGRILLDGRDMGELDLRTYRRHLAVVPQESFLFEGSVRANVTYGNDDLSDDTVREALRDANALDFVEQMGGLEAVIGERGARLSGGQRQRLAIARALIRDPRVLVLDEATSALDTASERLVQEALARLMEGRTTFVVAHRLTTIQGADRIVVMQDGRLVEQGTHEDLLAGRGAYSQLQGLST
ncbi:ABC transporter ATP-binding protein [Tessaracoccus antarcticus]|uniref:ABC transporter ATP-binding protein n=1 Tax=Tessaracoccus antarcticus TaxID=2479848 RepID=A0A3M0G366_9ACTN|nr:ABC transporter ATP-binding protein [Tessaracoccus antarcticus]RMB58978.1 ABC transporter ATP-binding protein [Tessaracoccus antarcticus]